MYSRCKYVVLAQSYGDGNGVREHIYLFPETIVHSQVAKRMQGKPVGAGFVARGPDNKLYCRGESNSLGVSSREEDNTLLRSLFL